MKAFYTSILFLGILFIPTAAYCKDNGEIKGRMKRWNPPKNQIGIMVVDTKDMEEIWLYPYNDKTVAKDRKGNVVEIRKLLGRHVIAVVKDRIVLTLTER